MAVLDLIVPRQCRFTTLLGGVLVAREKIGTWAVVVRIDDDGEQWDCYGSEVVFTSIENDRCQFVCGGKSFDCACRVLDWYDAAVIAAVADDLWSVP